MYALRPIDVAERLAIDATKVYRLIDRGDLTAVNVAVTTDGRPRWRITEAAFDEFVSQRSSRGTALDPPGHGGG